MPQVSTTTVRTDDVTLVELRVTASRPHAIEIEIRCEGPVWQPRSVECAAWRPDGVALEVPAGVTGVGFATPAPPGSVEVAVRDSEPTDDGVPTGLSEWLAAVRERVSRAERLAAAEDLVAATDAVASVGGLDAVERLAASLARDRRLMARFSFPPAELRERVASVRVPVAALRAVAQSRSS